MARFGTQQDVARALSLTDRRVRQMTSEFILPPARPDGRYDVDLCRQRYQLYSAGTPSGWDEFHAEMQQIFFEVETLISYGPGLPKTLPEITAASAKLQHAYAMMRFSIVCHQREDNFPRRCMLEKLQQLEDECLGRLISRMIEIMAEQQGTPSEQLAAVFAAQARETDCDPNAESPAEPHETPAAPNRPTRRAARHASR